MDYRPVARGPSRRTSAMTSLAAQHDSSDDVRPGAAGGESGRVEFRVSPDRYRHWRVSRDGPVATLTMDVDEQGGLVPGYELKLNSYDLGVDVELYDAVQRLRFEHPEVKAVVVTSGIEDATANSGQAYIAALNGTASGGGYELALACGHIMLVDDRSSAVSLPELPLLAVLPGTGGLTRVVDKRHR